MDDSKYFKGVDLADENNAYTKQINMVGENKRVVDFGCYTGGVAAVLAERGSISSQQLSCESVPASSRVKCRSTPRFRRGIRPASRCGR